MRNVLEGRKIMKRASSSLGTGLNWFHAFTISLCLAACGDDGGEADDNAETGDEGLAIAGNYVDDFATDHSISEDEWSTGDFHFAIVEYDNDEMYVIAQNAETNMFNPGLWSRFDWTWDGDQLYYCQSVFDGAAIEDARADSGDASDLAMGCQGFPWSLLTPS
jgi:hypothetical protein